MAEIPTDPYILLSFINTRLRDEYSSLEELCASLGIDAEELQDKLGAEGFDYEPAVNQFR